MNENKTLQAVHTRTTIHRPELNCNPLGRSLRVTIAAMAPKLILGFVLSMSLHANGFVWMQGLRLRRQTI